MDISENPAPAAPADASRADARRADGPGAGFASPGPDWPGSDSGPARPDLALADLIAARLVTHEMICDPARLCAEAPALGRLCALVAGAVYRIGPFHYAFRATPADLGGALAGLPFDDWTGALEAALRETLGPEAAWLSATDLLSDALALEGRADEEGAGGERAAGAEVPEGALALLRGREAAVAEGLAAAPAGAVIDAVHASETARLSARRAGEIAAELAREMAPEMAREISGEIARDLAPGLLAAITAEIRGAIRAEIAGQVAAAWPEPEAPGAVMATLATIADRLGALEPRAAAAGAGEADPGVGRIEAALEAVAARLDAGETRGALLGEHLAEHLTLRLGEVLGARAPAGPEPWSGPGSGSEFEETLGLALAEFLARIERATTDPGAARSH